MPATSRLQQRRTASRPSPVPGMEITSSLASYFSPLKAWNYPYNVWDAGTVNAGLGVPHVAEKPAIFGPANTGPCNGCSYETYNRPMVPIVMDFWISFILSLDPNTYRNPAAPEWMPWSAEGGGWSQVEVPA